MICDYHQTCLHIEQYYALNYLQCIAAHFLLFLLSTRICQVILNEELMKLYNCSEDDLPVDLDLLLIYNANEVERKDLLVSEEKCVISCLINSFAFAFTVLFDAH